MSEFADKVVVVTGGATGIGEAIVRIFAAEKARVVILDLNQDRAGALARDLGSNVSFGEIDVTKRASVEAAGLKLSLLEDLSARNEDNAPVPGLVAVATKT